MKSRHTQPISQEQIVFVLTVVLFVIFSFMLPNFLAANNILSLLRSVAVLGMLGLGMLVVVLGRGIDLSMVANMAISVAWTIQLVSRGMPLSLALMIGIGFSLVAGLINGLLIAYAEIPPLFATLAMGTFIYGFGRAHLITGTDVVYVPQTIGWILELGQGAFLGIPMPIIVAAVTALIGDLFLKYTKPGRFIFAVGDNLAAARIGAIAVRPILALQYALSGAIAFLAGVITATSVQAMNTRIAGPNLIYNVSRKKVFIARSLVQKLKRMIFDVPMRGADAGANAELHRVIDGLADAGLAVVMISSYLPEVLKLSGRVLVSRQGRIVDKFSFDEVAEEKILLTTVH